MAHLDNKLEWCITKAKKEGEKHRGLREVAPNKDKSKEHIRKAEHNLKAMIYLIKGGFPDWAINASFYARYHCLLAALAKHGYESRNQECTFAAVHHLIGKKAVNIDEAKVKKIFASDEPMDESTLVALREDSQYGTTMFADEPKMKELLEETKEFIRAIKAAL